MNIRPRNHNHHSHLEGRAQDPASGSNVFDNIRIHYDTSQLESDWPDSYDMKSYFVDDVIPAAFEWIQNALLVRPVDGDLTFERPCSTIWPQESTNAGQCASGPQGNDYRKCGETGAIIPQSMFEGPVVCSSADDASTCSVDTSYTQGSGLSDTDLVIYFTGDATKDATSACNNVMGFAAFCETNSRNRPIAGYINLCRSTIDSTEVLTWEEVISLIVHEAFHVLGFSEDGFDSFVDDNGDQLQDDEVYQTVNLRGKNRAVITLPTVVEKARDFFGCDTMVGVELEDYGQTAGSPSSHWDNRIITYDFMISYVPPAAPYSILTLAVFADSGWYEIDWKYAQQPPYGRGNGCDWYEEKCITNGVTIDDDIFCAEDVSYSCSSSHVGKFYCKTGVPWTNLPANQQYFSDPTLGGDNAYPDFCPLFEEYSNGDCRLWGANNDGTSDENTEALGGFISGTSKCALIEGETNGIAGGCFPTQCIKNATGSYVGTRLTIYRNYKLSAFDVITCWAEESGQVKDFPYDYKPTENYGFDTIYCPDFYDICYDSNPWICNGHGTIVDGVCVCSPGYFGIDCTIENTLANRGKYDDTDSVSLYNEEICNGGIWSYDIENDENVGIVEIIIANVLYNYDESNVQEAIKNWMAILTDISQCDVILDNYFYNGTHIITEVIYYSSSKTFDDVSSSDILYVFSQLFHSDHYLVHEVQKESQGTHDDNIDKVAKPDTIWLSMVISIIISSLFM